MFLANFFGLKIAKWISVIGGLSIFIVALVLGLFATAKTVRTGSATEFHLLPQFRLGTLNFWSQIAFAFLGLELAPVMGGEMRDPRRDLSRAAAISGAVCALFYIGGTASILVLLRPEDISPLTGLTQAVAAAAHTFGAPAVSAAMAMFIGLGIAGQLDTWIAGNTRLPYAIGLDRYLPEAFERLHPRWKTPYISLRIQVIACTLFLLMSQWGESVRAAYQIMVDMTVVVTFIPFLYIFGAGFRFGNRLAAASGLAVTLIAIVFASIPPAEIASPALFEVRVVGGGVLLALAGLGVFNRCQPRLQPRSIRIGN
jgi:amino acid transporter